MSLGQELAPHLPFLRRYARALTGSQAHGDAFVRATLEAIVAAIYTTGKCCRRADSLRDPSSNTAKRPPKSQTGPRAIARALSASTA